jgi:hypothetical protein
MQLMWVGGGGVPAWCTRRGCKARGGLSGLLQPAQGSLGQGGLPCSADTNGDHLAGTHWGHGLWSSG